MPLSEQAPLTLVTSANDGFAIGLAVMVQSALDTLGDRPLDVWVLDCGLTEETRERLLASWDDDRLRVLWRSIDAQRLANAPLTDRASTANYARLLIPEVLPESIGRAIYLDADLLVRRDLSELVAPMTGDDAALAVCELSSPVMDAERELGAYPSCSAHLAKSRPVANYAELGIAPSAPYFNSGVLAINLHRWREENLTELALQALRDHPEHAWCWDQYALNVALAGRWRPLDLRWNQTAFALGYPSWRASPFTAEAFHAVRSEPWIVHFTGPAKPWHAECRHPSVAAFREVQRRTAWRDAPLAAVGRSGRPMRALWDRVYETPRRRLKGWLRSAARKRRLATQRANPKASRIGLDGLLKTRPSSCVARAA